MFFSLYTLVVILVINSRYKLDDIFLTFYINTLKHFFMFCVKVTNECSISTFNILIMTRVLPRNIFKEGGSFNTMMYKICTFQSTLSLQI